MWINFLFTSHHFIWMLENSFYVFRDTLLPFKLLKDKHKAPCFFKGTKMGPGIQHDPNEGTALLSSLLHG